MPDLLSTELTLEEIVAFLSLRSPSADLPGAGDPAWDGVRTGHLTAPWVENLRLLAEDDCGRPLPELPEALYASSHESGDSAPFEQPYRERRRVLARAALCGLLFPGEPIWAARARQCLEAILSEPAWALPIHVHAATGIDPNHLDPAVATTSFLVAQTVAALGDRLGGAVRDAGLARLRERVFENYRARHGEYWWTRSTGHNNAVCHHGIVGAALAVEPDPGRVAQMLLLARNYLKVYVRGFGADGASREGVRRWEQGLGCFISLNDLIAARTIGQLALFSPGPVLHAGARFGPRMLLSDGKLVNFGDVPAEGSLDPGLLSRLAEVFADDEIAWAADKALVDLAATGIDFDSGEGSFRGWAALMLYAASSLSAPPPDAAPEPRAFQFEDASLLIVRGKDDVGHLWEFAAKGGHNAEPYNHNDCGSYLLNVDGIRVVAEIGMPQVTHDYLHRGRYDYLAARPLGHSLPLVNGFEQPSGPQAVAKVLTFESAAGVFEWSLDIAPCYPNEAACSDLIRTFRVAPGLGYVEVREFFELGRGTGYESAIITGHPVTKTSKATIIEAGAIRVVVEPNRGSVVERVERQEYADMHGHPQSVNRIVVRLEAPAAQGAAGYRLRLR
jgi:hypothetical protein